MTVRFNKKFLLLLVLSVLSLVILIIFMHKNENDKSYKTELEYRVAFENTEGIFREKIKEGDVVYSARTMSRLGTVVSVKNTDNYFVYEYDGVAEIVKKEFPDRYNIEVVIKTTADFTEGVGYEAAGVRIAVGRALELRFPDFVGRGYCRDIQEEGDCE